MKSQLTDYKDKLDQAQSDLSAWKFTPDRLANRSKRSRTSQNLHSHKKINPFAIEYWPQAVLYMYVLELM